jgi:hypothetical protein
MMVRLPRAVALLLALDDVDDQAHVLVDAGRLGMAVQERLAPVGHPRAVLDHRVEELAAHLDAHPRVGGDVLAHVDLGHLEAELLRVAAPVQVDAHDERQRLEGRDLVEERADGLVDERLGVLGHDGGL